MLKVVKNKKGFTLIELLAVIVIIAVIALIATPIIMNVINDAKKGSAKDSMYAYVKAVELDVAKNMQPDVDLLSGEFTTVDGNLYIGDTKKIDINIKGTKPSDREGSITLLNGKVTRAMLMFDGYDIGYDGNNVELATYKVGDEIYFDPTGSVADCKSGKEWTPSNTSTTCYKWNVIKDNGTNVEMLLDHNLENKALWISKADYLAAGGTEAEYATNGNNKYGPITLIKQLKTDTNLWSKVETLTNSDAVSRDVKNGTKYTINYNGMKARIISGQEIADIGKDILWKSSKWSGMKYTEKSWLYQNLSVASTLVKPVAYWVDTASVSNTSGAWYITYVGHIDSYYVGAGVNETRPVVRVLKSNL